jgi:polyol transport system permease protein
VTVALESRVPTRAMSDARRREARERRRRRIPLLPALIFVIIVTQLPFVATLVLSTLHWNVLNPGERSFAGLANYGTVFTDARLRNAVVNTVILTVSVVLVSLLIGLVLALLLDKRFFGRGLARTLLIAPFLVMPVAAALLWKHALYNPAYGL